MQMGVASVEGVAAGLSIKCVFVEHPWMQDRLLKGGSTGGEEDEVMSRREE